MRIFNTLASLALSLIAIAHILLLIHGTVTPLTTMITQTFARSSSPYVAIIKAITNRDDTPSADRADLDLFHPLSVIEAFVMRPHALGVGFNSTAEAGREVKEWLEVARTSLAGMVQDEQEWGRGQWPVEEEEEEEEARLYADLLRTARRVVDG